MRQTQINHSTGRIESKAVAKAKERALGTPVRNSTIGQRVRRALVG
jgi:hypothetical protein